MSDFRRRGFLRGAAFAVATASLAATGPFEAGDPSLMNYVPDLRQL